MTDRPRFHLAFGVLDLEETRRFYVDVIGARVGRSAERWLDFDFFGHQISAHLVDSQDAIPTHAVDGERVPVRHFGVILDWHAWHALRDRLTERGIAFLIEPQTRFQRQVGEQATFFLTDPSGNALEFKSFREDSAVFEH